MADKKPKSISVIYEDGETKEVLWVEIDNIKGDELIKSNMKDGFNVVVHKIEWLRWWLDRG